MVNCAGLYADRVALYFGFSRGYRILPLKGLYLHSDEPAGSYRTNIYPVPRLDRPFRGVHFTVDVTGRANIGPTATPAYWREHYRGLENFDATELWGEPGVRAQLLDVEERSPVMDFLLQGDGRSTHVLNAVSPGFTRALPFAEIVVDRIEGEQGRG